MAGDGPSSLHRPPGWVAKLIDHMSQRNAKFFVSLAEHGAHVQGLVSRSQLQDEAEVASGATQEELLVKLQATGALGADEEGRVVWLLGTHVQVFAFPPGTRGENPKNTGQVGSAKQ
eukprot:658106-Amphidinium_carterae.1